MVNINHILGRAALSGLVLLASENLAFPQDSAPNKPQDSAPAETPDTISEGTLFDQLKDYLDQDGMVKAEYLVDKDFRIDHFVIEEKLRVLLSFCEIYNINGKKLEACYTIYPSSRINEDGTEEHLISKLPTWWRLQGGLWYTDDGNGLNGDERLHIPYYPPLQENHPTPTISAPLNLKVVQK